MDEVKEELDRVFGPVPTYPGKSMRDRTKVLNPKGELPPRDNVVLPKHYSRFEIEPIYFIGQNKLNFFQGNIIKYILRHDAKNGLEDVRKAKRYCRMFELYLMGIEGWAGADPDDKKLQEIFREIHDAYQEFCRGPVKPMGSFLGILNSIEAKHNVHGPA